MTARIGSAPKRLKPEQGFLDVVGNLTQSGLSAREIAERLDVPRTRVEWALRSLRGRGELVARPTAPRPYLGPSDEAGAHRSARDGMAQA